MYSIPPPFLYNKIPAHSCDLSGSPLTWISTTICSGPWGVDRADSSVRGLGQSVERGGWLIALAIASGLMIGSLTIALAIISTALINKVK